jgi:hypothetical protein
VAIRRTRAEVADIIERFLDNSSGPWDWDDFTSISIEDADLERIRLFCVGARDDNAPIGQYCDEAGLELRRKFVRLLRSDESLLF